MSNNPHVLVEFDPEEITWPADRLHEEWQRARAGAIALTDEAKEKVKQYQEMQNRILNKASDQGFGEL